MKIYCNIFYIIKIYAKHNMNELKQNNLKAKP